MNCKERIRKKLREKLKQNPNKFENDRKIFHHTISLIKKFQAKEIFSYVSFGYEVDTINLIKFLLTYKIASLYVPKIEKHNLLVCKLNNLNELVKGRYGILEPITAPVSKKNFDILIVPGIAFDIKKNRLGRGKGYFDRFLKNINGIKVGICYDFQILDQIPANDRDVKMDIIISPNTVIK